MTYSVRNIVIALVLAAVAAGLVILYTGNVQKQAHDSQQNVTVVVAKASIAAGTPVKDLIATGAFQERQVVQRDVIPGAYTSVKDLNTSLATSGPVSAGAQITPEMFTEGTSAAIEDQLHGTDRAIQVSYNPNRVLNGTLQAGDHVDVLAVFDVQPARNNSQYSEMQASRIILSNITVLSTTAGGSASAALTADSQAANSTGSEDGTGGTALILKIPQDGLAAFNLARQYGHLWYALRPRSGAQDTAPGVATACSVLTPGLKLTQIRAYLPICFGGK
ncbi:MAG TPA: Flp pilus assembly protein CpaB [Gaiellales bacterium]|jgi:Flp pilus assembly protein CpaB|nr:Flp pilus assembly protein CpaB [Gaiellales bacterium]